MEAMRGRTLPTWGLPWKRLKHQDYLRRVKYGKMRLNLSRDVKIEASQMTRHGLLTMEGLSIHRETVKQELLNRMEV